MSINSEREKTDYWAEDEFEDTVASALIACFETKIKKNRGASPVDRLTDDRVALIRTKGPYIPSNSRIIQAPKNFIDYDTNWSFDIVNDRLPLNGLCAMRPTGLVAKSNPNSYLSMTYFRQSPVLGKCWHNVKGGTLYEMLSMQAENDGINGDRRFFTVTKQGEVVSCTKRVASIRGLTEYGEKVGVICSDDKCLHETSVWAAVSMQFIADKRHCWNITAQEKTARAHLGCMMEEIKSLLYARTLPMTSTGRKRPILHLVESHKRRMRNGTDVDVTAFLRGTQIVEIGGTVFRVNPPVTLRPEVSKPSQERYFSPVLSKI